MPNSMNKDAHEKRRYPRFDVVAKIRVRKDESGNKLQDAFVKNISAEGFCFYSKQAFKPGDALEVEITEDRIEEVPICVKGQVAWSVKNSEAKTAQEKEMFLTGIRVFGIRKNDEARFAMLYCERLLSELKSFLRL